VGGFVYNREELDWTGLACFGAVDCFLKPRVSIPTLSLSISVSLCLSHSWAQESKSLGVNNSTFYHLRID
jgi:hypothetical protein